MIVKFISLFHVYTLQYSSLTVSCMYKNTCVSLLRRLRILSVSVTAKCSCAYVCVYVDRYTDLLESRFDECTCRRVHAGQAPGKVQPLAACPACPPCCLPASQSRRQFAPVTLNATVVRAARTSDITRFYLNNSRGVQYIRVYTRRPAGLQYYPTSACLRTHQSRACPRISDGFDRPIVALGIFIAVSLALSKARRYKFRSICAFSRNLPIGYRFPGWVFRYGHVKHAPSPARRVMIYGLSDAECIVQLSYFALFLRSRSRGIANAGIRSLVGSVRLNGIDHIIYIFSATCVRMTVLRFYPISALEHAKGQLMNVE